MAFIPWLGRAIGLLASQPPPPPFKFGIDVSHHNGKVIWTEVKKNNPVVDFTCIKCTEGASRIDPKFIENAKGCASVKLPWIPYHFATWDDENEQADAATEAAHFIAMIKAAGKPYNSLAILDIESNGPIPYTKDEMVVYVKTFLAAIRAAGYRPVIYSSPGFLNSYLPVNHPFTDVLLWIADYNGEINSVPGWKTIWIRQYTDQGTIIGIAGKVDLNRIITPDAAS